MKPVMTVIGACIVILLTAAVMLGIRDFRSATYVEPHNVTTAVAVTTANVTLTQELFDDATSYVTIDSDNALDAAVPSSYTSTTTVLHVSGLNADDTRQLSINYRYNQLGSYWAADQGARIWPILLVIGIIGVAVGAVVSAFKRE